MTDTKASSAPMTFLAGLFIGSLVTALFTPRRGDELRQSIRSRSESISDKITKKADEVMDSADSAVDNIKTRLETKHSKDLEDLNNLTPFKNL